MMTGNRGFSLVEFIVALALLVLLVTGIAPLLFQSAQMNRSQQLVIETQANARSSVSLITQRLRTSGWDPREVGIPPLTVGTIANGGTNAVQIFADLNEDGDVNDQDENVLIRLVSNRIEWRRTAGGSFETLALNINNDPDGDGTADPLFVPTPLANPASITVQVTAQSPVMDPRLADFARFTVANEVTLRNSL
jgi:prepilin-type N-terminal cleavage/methylation domain-containing protein